MHLSKRTYRVKIAESSKTRLNVVNKTSKSALKATALETHGRIAAESHARLVALVAHVGTCMKDAWAAPRLLPVWRASLERTVQCATADIDLLCLGFDGVAQQGSD